MRRADRKINRPGADVKQEIMFRKYLPVIAILILALLLAVAGYRLLGKKKAPVAMADFESFHYAWGMADSLMNSYTSATGDYHYLDRNDSLIKTQVKLRPNDLIFIHNKINELGFWKLPEHIGANEHQPDLMVYQLEFKYKGTLKKMLVYKSRDQNADGRLDSAMQIVHMIQQVIDEADNRYH